MFDLIIAIAVVVVVFVVFRELVCWYWKINAGLEVLTEIRDIMKKANK